MASICYAPRDRVPSSWSLRSFRRGKMPNTRFRSSSIAAVFAECYSELNETGSRQRLSKFSIPSAMLRYPRRRASVRFRSSARGGSPGKGAFSLEKALSLYKSKAAK